MRLHGDSRTVQADSKPGSAPPCSSGIALFNKWPLLFLVISDACKVAARTITAPRMAALKRSKGEDHFMNDPRLGHPWWTRRRFLQGAASAAGAYGFAPGFGVAADVPDKYDGTGFKLKAPEPNAKPGG